MGLHQGLLRDSILQFKFHHNKTLGELLGELLAGKVTQTSWNIEAVVPVPMVSTRFRERLFNPAFVIAQKVAQATNRPCLNLLRVRRALPHQVGLGEKERRDNIRSAFSLVPGTDFKHKPVLLVDDVTTTGATLSECASVLQSGNPSIIYAATLAFDKKGNKP